jgi:photosystem II stability/assembly factor-like uncharacterized protein
LPDVRYSFDIFFLNAQKGWIGADQGFVFGTTSGGDTWTRQVAGLAKHAARMFFIDSDNGWAACGGAIIGKTSDGGAYWEQIILTNPPFPVDTVDFYGISFVNMRKGWTCAGRYPEYDAVAQETLFRGGQGYIATTNDSGYNWQLQKRDSIYDFFDMRSIDSLNSFVVGGSDRTMSGVVMKTTNGGQTWQSVSIPSQTKILRAIEFVGNRHAWAVGRNGTIIRTTDGGNSWITQQSNVDTTLFDVDFSDTLRGVISGNGYVLYTTNGGSTWQIANMNSIEESNNIFTNLSTKNIHAYPNPFHNYTNFNINIKTPNSHIKIYNSAGNLIKTFNIYSQNIRWDGIDDSNQQIPAGVYFVVQNDKGRQSVTPIVYQK